MSPDTKSRRDFFLTSLTGAAALSSLGHSVMAQTKSSGDGVPTRPLGKTGQQVSILCLGGWHIGAIDSADAIRIMHASIDEGLTFFDNAWEYHGGKSEEVMGQALVEPARRQKAFLMTKNCGRDYETSMQHLDDSLRRMKTDYLDLWQFHEIIYDNDPDWVFEKGAMKAALEARKAGKVRYIGFTGHKDPRIHLKMLDKPHDWDAAQMPINLMDAHYRSFQNQVLPVCLEKKVGVLGMKSLGGGFPKGRIVTETGVSAPECMRYALSLPISSLVSGISSMEDLDQALKVARGFKAMSDSEKKQLLSRVRPVATDGRHELFKSSQSFDGSVHRQQHGFES